MVWAFQRSLSIKFSNLDDKVVFQAELYENIDPETANAIIAATHFPNCSMQETSTMVNFLPIHDVLKNDIDKYIMKFEDTMEDPDVPSPLPFLYSTPVIIFVS